MESDPPPAPNHLGYESVFQAEQYLLVCHQNWNSALVRYETEAHRLAQRYQDLPKVREGTSEVLRRLALPWTSGNWAQICKHFRMQPTAYPDELARFIAGPNLQKPWAFLRRFHDSLRDADHVAEDDHIIAVLELCVEHRISWTHQDLALDAAICQLPLASRVDIDVSILKCNYQLFLVAITNTFPIPEDEFEYHLRRYHAFRVVESLIKLIIGYYKQEGHLDSCIPAPCRRWVWVMYNVIMRFLYHARTFNPANHLKDRTLYGWSVGILWKWISACLKVRATLTTLRDENPFQPGSHDFRLRIDIVHEIMRHMESDTRYQSHGCLYPFDRMIRDCEELDISPDLTWNLFKNIKEIKKIGNAAEILRALPHSTDRTFLGLDDEPGVKDEIAQLYDMMRRFVDLREYAFCEEHGCIGDW
ncbi:hypothetical protein SLS58_006426 [Diplodia intermedia]|uniref:Uncharacterized protein n=1 Tax=Diplodia intermedia TaxID=856260 RepID=A0ABR3TNK8_9PEZI